MIVLLMIVILSYATFYYSRQQLIESALVKSIGEERYRTVQNVNFSIRYIKGSNSE